MIDVIDRKLCANLRPRLLRAFATTALLAGLALAPAAAQAAPQVTGTAAAVSIDAQNSSIKDILGVLGQQFNVHLQSTAALDKQITGTYEGPLRQVLVRLLDGYNFIILVRDGRLQVTVLGGRAPSNGGTASATVAAAAPRSAQAAAPKTASAVEAVTAPSSTSSKTAGVPGVTPTASSAGPVPTFKVAEGPPPVPQSSPSSSKGPVAGPPTSKMPMPTPGGATTSTTPIPAPGPSTGNVPMPPSSAPTSTPSATPPAQTPQSK